MYGKANTTAHGYAIHHGEIGFGKRFDRGVHAILFREEGPRFFAIAHAALAEHGNISAGAEPSAAFGVVNHDHVNIGIERPNAQRRQDALTHIQIERVQGFRAIEGDVSDTPFGFRKD